MIRSKKALSLVSARRVTRLEKTSSSNNALQVFLLANSKSFSFSIMDRIML